MLFLARGGVPWHEIMKMSDQRRIACCVALGELDGFIFDWAGLTWSTPE